MGSKKVRALSVMGGSQTDVMEFARGRSAAAVASEGTRKLCLSMIDAARLDLRVHADPALPILDTRSARWQRDCKIRRAVHVQDEAREWVQSEATTVASFAWCCQVLDLDVDYVRRGLLPRRW